MNGDKVIAHMAQRIGSLAAELAITATALEEAQERITKLENPEVDEEPKPARPKAA